MTEFEYNILGCQVSFRQAKVRELTGEKEHGAAPGCYLRYSQSHQEVLLATQHSGCSAAALCALKSATPAQSTSSSLRP